jgi:aspartyl-tRNA(Asn)/glutamyl-tRNA(Gln) amidotransferase subunit A
MYKLRAIDLHKKFCSGELSATEIASYFLKRIDTFDQEVGSFLEVFHTRVIEQAKALDEKRARGEKLGRLAGVPIGIKDNIHVKGETTTCASKFLTNYKAPFNATVTELIEKEDGIILGKLNMDEFAMGSSTENSALKKTRNPWNLECVPGGSSGGSTAAVAARLCPLTLGTDTGGSVRQPASFCGVVGFKPTYGRVSRFGLVAFGSSLDQIGPIGTCSEDIGMLMEVLGKHDRHDATSIPDPASDYHFDPQHSLEGKKLGVPYKFLEGLNSEAAKCYEDSLKVMQKLGCELVDIDLSILKYAISTYYILATAEASTNLARFDGIRYGVRAPGKTLEEIYTQSRTQGFGHEVKMRILLGTYVLSSTFQEAFYKKAMKVRAKLIEQFDKVFQQCDLIATPVSPIACFPAGAIQDPLEMYLQDIYTIGVNLAKLPAISTPSGFNSEGKPFGFQLIGPRRSDVAVCQAAYAHEREVPFSQHIPPYFDKEAP